MTDLFEAYMAHNQDGRSNWIGPSSIHTCYRQHAYNYLDCEPTDQVDKSAADFGTMIHLGYTAMIRAMHDPAEREPDVTIEWGGPRPGSADDVDYVNKVVTDLKVPGGKSYQWQVERGASKSYTDQLMVYAHGLTLAHGGDWTCRLYLINRDNPEQRHTIEFPYDPDRARELVALANRRHTALRHAATEVEALKSSSAERRYSRAEEFPREGKGPGSFPCVAPGTLIQLADLTWVPVEDVRVGDTLMGRDEKGSVGKRAKTRPTVVTEVRRRIAELVTVNGALTVAAEKRFSSKGKWIEANRMQGRRAEFLAAPIKHDTALYQRGWLAGMVDGDGTFWYANGHLRHRAFRLALTVDAEILFARFDTYTATHGFTFLPHVHNAGQHHGAQYLMPARRLNRHLEVERFERWVAEDIDDPSFWWGYLAGITDAEGSVTGQSGSPRSGGIRISQYLSANPATYERIGLALKAVEVKASPERNGWYIRMTGGGLWRFLAGTLPARPCFARLAFDRRPHNSVTVATVEPAGTGEVISLTTDCGTYIAEGYVVHNCDWCAFESRCWPEATVAGGSPQSETIKDDPDAVGFWIGEYLEASAEASKADARKRDARVFLSGIEGSYPLPDGTVGKVSYGGGKPTSTPDCEALVEAFNELGMVVPVKDGTTPLRIKVERVAGRLRMRGDL